MAQGAIIGQSGGSNKINGIIEEYKVASGGNVNAGDFVKFVEEEYKESKSYNITRTDFQSVFLENAKIFMVYLKNNKVYGKVCTFTDTELIENTETQISQVAITGFVYIQSLKENKVILIYKNAGNIYGNICTIIGEEITAGIETQINNNSDGNNAVVDILDENTVLVLSSRYNINPNNMQGQVCKIVDYEIDVGVETTISVNLEKQGKIAVNKIATDKIFIGFEHDNGRLYGEVCIITENEITAGTETKISEDTQSTDLLVTQTVADDKVCIIHRANLLNAYTCYTCLRVCTITGAEITGGTDTSNSNYIINNPFIILTRGITASTSNFNNLKIKFILLNNNRFIIVYPDSIDTKTGSPMYLYSRTITINDNKFNASSPKAIETISSLLKYLEICKSKNEAVIVFNDNVVDTIKTKKIILNTIDKANGNDILGIVKEKGTAGQTVKVIVPNQEGEN